MEEAEYNHIWVFVTMHMENSILGFYNKKSLMLEKWMCVFFLCMQCMGAKYEVVDGLFDYFCIFAHLSGMKGK